MGNALDLPHPLDLDLDLTNLEVAYQFGGNVQVLADGILNVTQGFLFGDSLGPASRQTWDGDAIAFLGMVKSDFVFHGCT
jgi:hypothetical protein